MKNTCMLSLLTLLLCGTLTAQTPLAVEYFNERFPTNTQLGNFEIQDLMSQYVVYRVGQNLIIRSVSQQTTYFLTPDDINSPDYNVDDYKLYGFADVVGDANKELIVSPRDAASNLAIFVCSLKSDNHFKADYYLPPPSNEGITLIQVRNVDGDPQHELITAIGNPFGLGGTVSLGVYGMGHTQGLHTAGGTAFSGSSGCNNPFIVDRVLPPNFRWPQDRAYYPDGIWDLDNDGRDDFGFHLIDTSDGAIVWVISGNKHDTLFQKTLPTDDLSLNFTKVTFIFVDFCDTGEKQIMMGFSNSGTALRDMEIILILDPHTGEIVWADEFMAILNAGFRLVSFLPNNTMAFEHKATKRVIIAGPYNEFHGGGDEKQFQSMLPENGSSYVLHKLWESNTQATLYMPVKQPFEANDLDVNGDALADIPALVLQDSTGGEAIGFTVYSSVDGAVIWETAWPLGAAIDPAPYFHGFFDANADGAKELFLGAETIQTADGVFHKPFEPGFTVQYLYDLNGDGFTDVLGTTPEGKLQVWSSAMSTPVQDVSPQFYTHMTASPNPSASGQFLISWTQPAPGPARFDVFNEIGQLVTQHTLDLVAEGQASTLLPLPATLPNGLYLARCNGLPTGQQTVMLVLQR